MRAFGLGLISSMRLNSRKDRHPICKISFVDLYSELDTRVLPHLKGNNNWCKTNTHRHTFGIYYNFNSEVVSRGVQWRNYLSLQIFWKLTALQVLTCTFYALFQSSYHTELRWEAASDHWWLFNVSFDCWAKLCSSKSVQLKRGV